MATIIVNWQSKQKTPLIRMELRLDNKFLGYIKPGETLQFKVAAGQHKLKAAMWPFSKKLVFEIADNGLHAFELLCEMHEPSYVAGSFLEFMIEFFMLLLSWSSATLTEVSPEAHVLNS